MRPTRVMIIIVSTNDGRWLEGCITSLAPAMEEEWDVVVVDNVCRDGTRQVCDAAPMPITLITTKQRRGFAACNNIALLRAIEEKYQYAFLVNPDTVLHQDAVRQLVGFLEACPEYGIAGSMQFCYGDGSWTAWNPWTTETVKHARSLGATVINGVSHTWIDHYYVQGAALMLRLDLVPRIGLLDPLYVTFYEETDLCRRCLLAGSKVGLVFDSMVQHYGGGNWRGDSLRRRERDLLFLRNQLFFYLSCEASGVGVARTLFGLVRRHYRALRYGSEDVVLNWTAYPQILGAFLKDSRYLSRLARRNRLVREGRALPRDLWSIGPSHARERSSSVFKERG
jgi:GT2 family glycosyltransferase